MTHVRTNPIRDETASQSYVGRDRFPPVIAHFWLNIEEIYIGRGRIYGFYKLSATVIHLGRITDTINLIPPDGVAIGSNCYASYAAASYAMELWAAAYLTKRASQTGIGHQSEQNVLKGRL